MDASWHAAHRFLHEMSVRWSNLLTFPCKSIHKLLEWCLANWLTGWRVGRLVSGENIISSVHYIELASTTCCSCVYWTVLFNFHCSLNEWLSNWLTSWLTNERTNSSNSSNDDDGANKNNNYLLRAFISHQSLLFLSLSLSLEPRERERERERARERKIGRQTDSQTNF